MEIHVHRVAMIGGGLSYDVLVKFDTASEYAQKRCSGRTSIDGIWYMPIYAARCTPELEALPRMSTERIEAWDAHFKKCHAEASGYARKAFPELENTTVAYDALWHTGLLDTEETSEVVIFENVD